MDLKKIATTLFGSLILSTGIIACGGVEGEESFEENEDALATKGTVTLKPGWICIAQGGTCFGGGTWMYCYESGKESDGIMSCYKPPAE